MSTPPGNYDSLDALAAATPASADVAPSAGQEITFQSSTIPPAFNFTLDGIQPPPALYMGKNDTIFVSVLNSDPQMTQVTVSYRILTPDGIIQVSFNTLGPVNATRAFQDFQLSPGEGFLLGVNVDGAAFNGQRGRTYIGVAIARGNPPSTIVYHALIEAYLGAGIGPSWPTPYVENTLSGQGWLHANVGTVPVAGANISELVPLGARWRLRAARFSLTTSAAVGNRQVQVSLFDAAPHEFYRSVVVFNQAPGSTVTYSVSDTLQAVGIGGDTQLVIPRDAMLDAGFKWTTTTAGIDVADQFTAPTYQVEEWLNPTS
jgi:hypothetical protein